MGKMRHFTFGKFGFGKLALATVIAVGLLVDPNETTASDHWVEHVIEPDGSAKFLLVNGSHRTELWTVSCRLPMRGCVARGQGMKIWIDGGMRAHLIAAIAPNARISVIWRNQSQDWPNLFSSPLSAEAISSLTRHEAMLVIQENGRVALNGRTEGVALLIDYLRWLKSGPARVARDARNWTAGGTASSDPDAISPYLKRYRASEAANYTAPPVLVPYTKPQAEFSIGAQNGRSFYVERGL